MIAPRHTHLIVSAVLRPDDRLLIDVETHDGKHSKEAVARIRMPQLRAADGIRTLRASIGIVEGILSLLQSSEIRAAPDA